MPGDPLVSVILITYNSEKHILETLESIKAQTYQNMELIVSDDCSTDRTIPMVKKWLLINKNRFFHYKIVESTINTGITKNCNRGANAAEGAFFKFLAGDDLLLNNCIEDLLHFCLDNNLELALSRAIPFYDDHASPDAADTLIQQDFITNFFAKDQKAQYKEFLTRFRIGTSLIGGIFKKTLFLRIGGFNEKYPMMEDYPFFLSLLSSGYHLTLLDKYTVKYRVHAPHTIVDFKNTPRYTVWHESLRLFESEELLPRLRKKKMYLGIFDLFIKRHALQIFSEHNGRFAVIFAKLLRYLSPLTIKDKLIYIKYKLNHGCNGTV